MGLVKEAKEAKEGRKSTTELASSGWWQTTALEVRLGDQAQK